MKNLTLTLEEEISILDKYGLTPNELLVLRVLLLFQDEQEEELLQRLLTTLKHVKVKFREVLIELQRKEIILKSYKIPPIGETFDPLAIPINKNFIKNLYKCSFELGKELFETYPQMTLINGCMVTLRGVSKHFDSLENCYFKYGKAIGWNQERHEKIIDLVKWAKEKDLIKQSLSSFVINNAWLDLEAIRNGDSGNYNFDTVKAL